MIQAHVCFPIMEKAGNRNDFMAFIRESFRVHKKEMLMTNGKRYVRIITDELHTNRKPQCHEHWGFI